MLLDLEKNSSEFLAGAVYEAVNELQSEKSDVPSSAEEGWTIS
jgi:hypothetical protein